MKVLLIGGTGAMGVPLTELLAKNKNNKILVTSRSKYPDSDNISYIQGDIRQEKFLDLILEMEPYDAIFDFMVYSTNEFETILPRYLSTTKQYFFFSSSRCYAGSSSIISENSPRLIDVCKDKEYLETDEYGLAKGKEENILYNCGKKNWTIIRPYITYNIYRIQLGVYEKENWLRRALNGQTIILPKDIAEKKTSLTYGPDVAKVLVKLIGNEKAFGEAFHITTNECHTWNEIFMFYCDIVERETGKRPKIKYVENSIDLQTVWNKWQIRYDRLYDRTFCNSKIEDAIGECSYRPTFEGVDECLTNFLKKPIWRDMNWRYEAWCDKQTGEWPKFAEIKGIRMKIRYLKWRIIG